MPRRISAHGDAERILDAGETTLVDVVDNALAKGVVLTGDLTLAIADVDLVYARLSLLLCAADRVLPRAAGARQRPPSGRVPKRRILLPPSGRVPKRRALRPPPR